MTMREHVARGLCYAAATDLSPGCSHCEDGACSMWPQFMREADFAVQAVRDHARLDMRRHPKARASYAELEPASC